jgi:hypothetical protein
MTSLTKSVASPYKRYQSTDENIQPIAEPMSPEEPSEPVGAHKSNGVQDIVKHLHKQAEDVGKIMKENMSKVLERHEKLVDLEDRSQSLEESVRNTSLNS